MYCCSSKHVVACSTIILSQRHREHQGEELKHHRTPPPEGTLGVPHHTPPQLIPADKYCPNDALPLIPLLFSSFPFGLILKMDFKFNSMNAPVYQAVGSVL